MSRHYDQPDLDDDQDDLGITHTDADQVSQTRFGPRPVPEGHRPPSGPRGSRRIPPSGPVSPDGQRSYPRPSRLAKWVVWGGTGIAAAALTAGTVYAARHVADLLSGDDQPPKRRPGQGKPRMQMPTFAERTARNDQVQDDHPQRFRDDRLQSDRFAGDQTPRPRRKPAPRKGLMHEIQDNTAGLTHSLDNVMNSLVAAVTGFRTVASQAAGIMREFGDAASLVRGVMGDAPAPKDKPRRAEGKGRNGDYPDRHGAHMPDLHDDPAAQDPLQDADFDPRTHRL